MHAHDGILVEGDARWNLMPQLRICSVHPSYSKLGEEYTCLNMSVAPVRFTFAYRVVRR